MESPNIPVRALTIPPPRRRPPAANPRGGSMRLQWSCRATVIAVLVACLGWSVLPGRVEARSFGGQATGVQVFVPATGLTIKAASGQLSPSGGEVDASLLSGDIPGSTTGGVVALAAGTTAELRVVALHVTTIDAITSQVLADVQLAIADARIDCQPGSGPPGDATTGGGWIPVTGGGKGTFGVGAAYQPDGSLAGHLVYIDHDIDLKVQGTAMTNFVPGCTSQIDGNATANSTPVTFNVTVEDQGEPGTSDTFSIEVPELGYIRSGTLGGGNIQVHRMHCP